MTGFAFGLSSFLGDLDRDAFYREHWDFGFLSLPGDLERFAPLSSVPLFSSWESMVEQHRGLVDVFFKDGGRGEIPKHRCQDVLNEGGTLYLNLSRVGAIDRFTEALAADLGCREVDITVEGFVSEAGSLSTAHFDPEHNFHVVLSGKKVWRLAENPAVPRPLSNFVMGAPNAEDALVQRYRESELAETFPEDATEFEVGPGDAIYFAPGVWHEVRCLELSTSVNFAVRPAPWSKLIARALERELEMDPDFRERVFGLFGQRDALKSRFTDVLRPKLVEVAERLKPGRVLKPPAKEED